MSPTLAARVAPQTYVAEVGAGDLIYWPGYWFHEVTNFDDQSLAISVFLDELRLSPLLLRHLLFHTLNAFTQIMHAHLEDAPLTRADLATMDVTFMDLPFIGLLDLFREYEAFLLSDECAATRHLWAWNSTRVIRR